MHRELEDLVLSAGGGEIVVLEAPHGPARRRLLQDAVETARQAGASAWLLPCAVSEAGLWAGASGLVEALLPATREHAPDLLDAHHLSLAALIPELAAEHGQLVTLTDTATGVEAVRNYALDRAYRIPHGLVDYLDDLFRRAPFAARKVLVCDDFDRSGVLVRRFFHQLVRRRGRELGITLVLAVEPGKTAKALEAFGDTGTRHLLRLDLESEAVEPLTPREWTRRAVALEEKVRVSTGDMEIHVPELIRMWQESDHPERARYWQAYALAHYNHRGFYEDAAAFIDGVLENVDDLVTNTGNFTRWNLVGGIFGCLVAIGQAERAYEVILKEAWAKVTEPAERARVCYVMAMAHARFLPERDLDRAEAYLEEGLALLDSEGIEPEIRHFLTVFLNNGLALIRHRQGYPSEAIDLCREGFQHLSENMPGDKHRLHRSVLLYNIAQVFTATKEYEQAIEYFTGAMEMDPNYSEYFNERGNAYLKLGRFEEAIRDYEEAIRLSPPYAEVWTNLAQCYRRQGRLADAERAYARSIDLEPSVNLAHAGRAHVLDQLGRMDEALEEYGAALALDPSQPLLLSNRAALLYRMGRLADSLADLDHAVGLAPSNPVLYRNRAAALADLERPDDAACDLERYLELMPSAPDRAEVEERLAAFRGPAVLV